MKISARNQLKGTVTAITRGAVNGVVTIDLGSTVIKAGITLEAIEALGLVEGSEAYAIIKATNVLIAAGSEPIVGISARNQLVGTVVAVKEDAVNGHVTLELAGGARHGFHYQRGHRKPGHHHGNARHRHRQGNRRYRGRGLSRTANTLRAHGAAPCARGISPLSTARATPHPAFRRLVLANLPSASPTQPGPRETAGSVAGLTGARRYAAPSIPCCTSDGT